MWKKKPNDDDKKTRTYKQDIERKKDRNKNNKR